MKRSATVTAPLLASVALAMTAGCGKPEMQRCVDENNHVVDDSLCGNQPTAAQNQNPHGSFYFPHVYRNYYGGWGGFGSGTAVGGGTYAPVEGHSYANSLGRVTIRGGFGGWFRNLFRSGFHGVGE